MKSLLSVQVAGHPLLETKVQQLAEALDTRAILDEGAAVLFNRMRTRFLQETDPTGAKWPPSKAAIQRQKIGRGGGTLFDTGHLWRSLQLYADTDNSRAIGTDATSKKGFPYPIVHQYGIKQVRRQFLGFGEEDVSLMTQVVVRRITDSLGL